MSHVKEFKIRTGHRNNFYLVTEEVQSYVQKTGVKEGICVIHVPHTTAGITVNENADPDVVRDMTVFLNQMIPCSPDFRHSEGNSDSHIKTTLVSPSVTLIVSGGRCLLGVWQGIYFCEFDGPRNRTYWVKVLPG